MAPPNLNPLNYIPSPGQVVTAVGDAVNYAARGATWAADAAFNMTMADASDAAKLDSFRNSQYNFNYTAFPSDLTTSYNGHYMVININVPTSITNRNAPRGAYTDWYNTLNGQLSTVDRARFSTIEGAEGGVAGAGGALSRAAFSTGRRTRRIAESIALYMPSGLVYNQQNKYEEVSMTALAGKAATAGTGLAVGAAAGMLGRNLEAGIQAGAKARQVVDGAGKLLGTASSLAGYPINPRVEVLYSHTDLRSFRFELLLAPRNEQESMAIDKIIRTLRFHAVPELDPQTAGFTFIPPAEFDISFYNKGVENVKIPRINTCVLNVIEVDYAPTNGVYSTFSNGYPVAVRLSIGFTEVEPLHKARVAQGF